MTHEFAKYPDGTVAVFSDIGKKEDKTEYLRVTFERATKKGFDTLVIEVPGYKVIYEDGEYTAEEKKRFMKITKSGSAFFFKYAKIGGLEIA